MTYCFPVAAAATRTCKGLQSLVLYSPFFSIISNETRHESNVIELINAQEKVENFFSTKKLLRLQHELTPEEVGVPDSPLGHLDTLSSTLEFLGVNQVVSRKISRRDLNYLISRQITVRTQRGSRVTEAAPSQLVELLGKRVPYRGPITPLTEFDIETILAICNCSSTYRPFPLPGSLRVVSLFFLTQALSVCHLGEGNHNLLSITKASRFRDFLLRSFVSRDEIEDGVESHVAVGIDLDPLLAKYEGRGVGLAFLTMGCVLETLSLISASLSLSCVILFGNRDLKLWRLGDRKLLLIPVALRIGRALDIAV